ncbi:hypothetical protein B0H66DRAFT_498897 [Apodospora peruviana]|uniref:Polyketide synthase n=1 Tax=Apodospora peruviana TaxID=516989 RepID=A0AAE0HZQ0_9PEZI|nr:hypothetical protein B0H66DRAFT_498897 [Apodospora peruviana]
MAGTQNGGGSGRIAVVGMACRLPGGADSPQSLWSMLAEGRHGRKEVPRDRWNWESFYHKATDAKDATNFSHGYFLNEDVSLFDARFFGIASAEATGIDPQQRLLLEVTYEASENAGIPLEKLRGSNTSVHMAMFSKDYDRMGYKDGAQLHKSHILGSGDAILANRISYLLDLKGTSNALDTGCSGSLLALHQACQTLRADEAEIALAGASQLLLSPDQSTAMSSLTNKDGRCYTFDDRGAGYARGEGLGVLVLKKLDRAIADGDNIQAVIVESGSNHDGKTSGIFLPNPDAQEALARAVYAKAGLDPTETLFVEAHGTGTQAGDKAEIGSISKVFGREAGRKGELVVGSIKSNIGHLEASSGVASLVKAVMVLKKNQIPPQLNFVTPKPTLHLDERGIKIPLELTPLTPVGYEGPRRVSVNSFGYGGTNAHAILEAYDADAITTKALTNGNRPSSTAQEKLVVVSADTELSLTNLISRLRTWLTSDNGKATSFDDLVYTLNVRRSKLSYRASVIATDSEDLGKALGDTKQVRPVKASRDHVALGFIFTGQGAQWYAMGRELLTTSEIFASTIAHCNQVMKDLGCEWDLVEELSRDKETSRLGESRFSQPCTTAVQIALVDLLATRHGIRPEAVCGHSSGEIAAAYTAGALSREAAMQVSYLRGVCSSKAKALNITKGAMLAVGEGEAAINKRIAKLDSSLGKVVVACVNSPESITASGDEPAIDQLQAMLESAGVFNRKLKVDSAYHSHHMEVVSEMYTSSLDAVGMKGDVPSEDVAFFSSVTGARKHSGFGPAYWNSNSVGQVKFSAAAALVADHLSKSNESGKSKVVIAEIGPHSALAGPLRQTLSEVKYDYLSALVRNESAVRTVLAMVGKLFEFGGQVKLDDGHRYKVVDTLPTYPWDHSAGSYWHESRLSKDYRLRKFPRHDLVGILDVASSPYEPRWRHHVSLEALPWLRDHVIDQFVIFPGAGYLVMVLEAMKQLFQIRKTPGVLKNVNFRDVTFAKPVVIYDDPGAQGSREVELQLVITPSRQHAGSPWENFRVLSYDSQNESWIDNCHGLVSWDAEVAQTQNQTDFVAAADAGLGHLTAAAADKLFESIQSSSPTTIPTAEAYTDLRSSGNEYGPTFQLLDEIHVGKSRGTAKIVMKDIAETMPGQYMQAHTIHPSAFDSILHLQSLVFRRECSVAPLMPVMIGDASIAVDGVEITAPGTELMVALELFPESKREATATFCAYHKQADGTLRPVLTGSEVRIQAVGDAAGDKDAAQKKMSYRMEWKADVDFVKADDFKKGPNPFEEYMLALVHKNPYMKVLGVAGSTAGGSADATVKLMDKLERAGGRLAVDGYTYTGVSADILEAARAKATTSQIDFKTLDISRDPVSQGFAAHTFDLAVVSGGLNASVLDTTMANVRTLLKTGGRLLVVELTALVDAADKAVYDTLEDSEDEGLEVDGPLLTVSEWDERLKRFGFSGADLAVPAYKGRSNSDVGTLIVAQAVEAAANDKIVATTTIHLTYPSDTAQAALADQLSASLRSRDIQCTQENDVWSVSADPNSLAVVIDSAEHPLLLDFGSDDPRFQQVKQLLLDGKNILWVSFQGTAGSSVELAAVKNMANGLARVARRENPDLRFITVDVQDQIQPSVVQILTQVAFSSFFGSPEATPEFEYVVRDGKLTIPRVVPDQQFASYADSTNSNNETSLVECKYLDQDRPLMFSVQVPGLLNTIRFVDNDKMAEPLGADEIQVETRAHGVNFKDVFIALGQMAPGTIMTGEVAGVITAVGTNAGRWKVGDRVVGVFVDPYGSHVRINSKGVVAIPDSVSFADAASIPITYYTAWYCLTHVARFEKGQSILIHAASGGVGQAAIQLAQLIGASDIYVTVGSAAKKKIVQEKYGIPDSHIFSSHAGNFKKHILNMTNGNGVDAVLNSLSGQGLRDSWDCVGQFGTFLEIGKTDIYGRAQLSMANFEKQITFAAVDISHMYQKRPELVATGLREIFAMVDQGTLKTAHPVTTYPMSQIEEVFRQVVARKHIGKLVLVADEKTLVQATRPKARPLKLYKDGTYVIGGGLGDLGKKMASFLAEKGAGHIVALTRRNLNVEQRKQYKAFMDSITELGGTLHIVQCDISDESSTRACGEQLRATLPPIRGIIQSALVLRDHPLEFMELDDWKISVKPKVHGTLNMHKGFCSPQTTEFFVMLSSISSIIGSNSQSNYAAGNAFQDAFAAAAKEAAQAGSITNYIAINAGAVEGSGLINNLKDGLNHGRDIASMVGSVTFDEVLATLEYAMGPQARADDATQVIMHFNRDTMEDAMGANALAEHMFDHVPSKKRQGGAKAGNGAGAKKQSVTQAIEQAQSAAEAEEIVKQALLDKFASFVGDHVRADDQPIAALGLDSLVSIELKNWVKHTFQTPLQVSELSGAKGIAPLAKLIVSRMPHLKAKTSCGAAPEEDKVAPAPKKQQPPAAAVVKNTESTGVNCCKVVQPLPDLDDVLDYWLEANAHLFTARRLETIQREIDAMRAADSPARRILEDLYAKHAASDPTNKWFSDLVTEARFLCARGPIAPWASIMASHGDTQTKTPHTQAERAAIITSAALSFRRAMNAGEVEPLELVAGKPECTFRWGWLFNSARVPQIKVDKMVSYSADAATGHDHIAVLRKGRLFKVVVQDGDKDVDFSTLQATFEAIIAQAGNEQLWSGILTTDERDSWAKTRSSLEALAPENASYFRVIDSAMFVLSLDSGKPTSPKEIAQQGYIGDGANRWFDKVLQFFVSENGRSGQITEHGIVDGNTPVRLVEWVAKGMASYTRTSQPKKIAVKLKEVTLQTTPEIDSQIGALRKKFAATTSRHAYVRETLPEFGVDYLMESGAPVKGVIDLTFQLAVRLSFGRNMLSWEPMSAAHFHTGRSDALQRATPAVNAFCDAAASSSSSLSNSELKQLLLAATKQMNGNMASMLATGRSYLRTFEVISYLWDQYANGEPKPAFLGEHVFFGRPFPPVFAQTNAFDLEADTGNPVDDFVHLVNDADGLWSILVPERTGIRFSLTGGSDKVGGFVKRLHEAAGIMKEIVKRN